uniref:Uncharacterized protein n=1 Tax=Hanusia phi TaxID=3032 RepID=A0A7S0EWA0_9CRYP|mmetsp:Transcript_3311/g.7969  ORF Transcript_3311/g.7969 Transcript_3311/m.7969 type:complete len:228 (+) Transcript_3311:275-958(+)
MSYTARPRRIFLEPCFLVQALEDHLASPCSRYEEFSQVKHQEKKARGSSTDIAPHDQPRWCPRSTFHCEEDAWREFDASSTFSLHATVYDAEKYITDQGCQTEGGSRETTDSDTTDRLLAEEEEEDTNRVSNAAEEEELQHWEISWEEASSNNELESQFPPEQVTCERRKGRQRRDEAIWLQIDDLQVIDSDPESSSVADDSDNDILSPAENELIRSASPATVVSQR